MANYSSPLYWQERYAYDPSASFDWYMTYDELRPHLLPLLSKSRDFEIFLPGCGNSTLGARLFEDGYRNVSNVDISSVVISQLRERYVAMADMDFSVLDSCDMLESLPEPAYDLIMDKALLDSVLCGEDAWRRVTAMISEMHRVLRPGGTYVVLSYGQPSSRIGYLSVPGVTWSISVLEIPKPPLLEGFKEPEGASSSVYYMYTCTKASPPTETNTAATAARREPPEL